VREAANSCGWLRVRDGSLLVVSGEMMVEMRTARAYHDLIAHSQVFHLLLSTSSVSGPLKEIRTGLLFVATTALQ
jgi:hypothetical protein